jgi:UDP-N-acetylmuramoyl-tripeptide--D-alanyl-D-alanine ligase
LRPTHRYAVIEMGMNHPGELSYLTRTRPVPTWRWSTTPCARTWKGLGSVEAVARAKGEIYAGLKPDGIAIVNADDPARRSLARAWPAPIKVMSFGFAADADVRIGEGGF